MTSLVSTPMLHLCGKLRVTVGTNTYDGFPTRRSASILARLGVASGESLNREALCRTLWPDEQLSISRTLLRNEIARLRRALGGDPAYFRATRSTLSLDDQLITTDLDWARSLLKGFDPKQTDAVEIAQKVISLIRNPLLEGTNEEWLLLPDERRIQLLREWSAALAVAGCMQDNAPFDESLVTEALTLDPTNEWVVRAAMERAIRSGRSADAVRLYQSLYATLSQGFGIEPSPELRALASQIADPEAKYKVGPPPSNVPYSVRGLVGRTKEIAELLEILSPGEKNTMRLVTILGSGGMGKTRLALEVSQRLGKSYDNRIWFADTSDVRDSAMLLDAIFERIGIDFHARQDRSKFLDQILDGKPGLFIIDNFEQVDSRGANVLIDLLQQNPTLRVLVTSRRRLGLSGEYEYPIPPLPPNEAIELYLESSPQTQPDDDLNQLIDLLEGIPLAINLAASYGSILSPKQSLEQAKSRFSFLVDPTETQPLRHRRLWDTIEWSYQLLDQEHQEALVGLTVFRGGWTAEAAGAVLGLSEPHRILEKLVSNSLVTTRPTVNGIRFGLLETVQEFGAAKLSPKQAKVLHDHHFRFYSDLVKLKCESRQVRTYHEQSRHIDLDFDNIGQCILWALDHEPSTAVMMANLLYSFWHTKGYHSHGLKWMRRVLVPPYEISEHSLGALHGAGVMALALGLVSEANSYFEASAQIGEEIGDEVLRHIVLGRISEVRRLEGNYASSLELGQRCLEFFSQDEDAYHRSYIYPDVALSLCPMGRLDEALRAAEECLTTRLRTRHSPLIADTLSLVGRIHVERNDLSQARSYFDRALEQYYVDVSPIGLYRLLIERVSLDLDEGDLASAEKQLDQLEQLGFTLGNENDHNQVMQLQSRLHLAKNLGSQAQSLLLESVNTNAQRTVLQTLNLLDGMSFVVWNLGFKSESAAIRADCDRLRRLNAVPRYPSEERRIRHIDVANPTTKLFTPEECLQFWAALAPR